MKTNMTLKIDSEILREIRIIAAEEGSSTSGLLSLKLQELCLNLRRKMAKPRTVEEMRILILDYMNWQIVVNTPDSVIEALAIEAHYQISFRDALLVHAAERSGAAILYSEDVSDGRNFGSVRVVNPFNDATPDGSFSFLSTLEVRRFQYSFAGLHPYFSVNRHGF